MSDTKKRILVSTSAQILSQIFVAGTAVVILKLLTNRLGVTDYGIYATALAFVTTFSLLTDLGLNAITGREIAKHPADADLIISHNMGLRLVLCTLMLPLIIGLSFVFYPHSTSGLRNSIALLSIYLVFDAIRSVSLAYFTAKVRNDIAAAVGAAQQLVLLILSVGVSFYFHNVYGFIIAYVLSTAAGAVIAVYVTRHHVKIFPKISFKHWRTIIGMSLSLGIIQIINLLYLKTDSLLLSLLKGPTDVGIYGIAYSLVLTFLTLPSFIMTALVPSMATAKDNAELGAIVEKSYSYMIIFACLLAVGGFIVRKEIILTVSNSSFLAAATPFAILCFASAFSYLNNVFGFACVSINKHHKFVFLSIGTLGLNLILNFLLIPRYSIVGAAWATFACEIIALIFAYFIFARETNIRIRIYRHTYKPLIAAAIALVLCCEIKFFWNTSSALANMIIAGILVTLIYIFTLTLQRGLPLEVSLFAGRRFKSVYVVCQTFLRRSQSKP